MLYVMQHGEAVPKEEDADRPLDARGQQDVARIATLLAAAGVGCDTIVDSGKPRARQSAEILARRLAPADGPRALEGLGPKDPPAPVAAQLAARTGDTLLVGHLPFVGALVDVLLGGDGQGTPVAFVPGTVVALEPADGGWRIAWMLRPGLLAGGE